MTNDPRTSPTSFVSGALGRLARACDWLAKAFSVTGRIITVVLTGIFLLFVGSCTVGILLSGPKHAANGPVSLGRIPAEATNIDYVEPAPFAPATYASFDIPEAGYQAWVADWRSHVPELSLPSVPGELLQVTYDPVADKVIDRTIPRAMRSFYQIDDQLLSLVYDLDQRRAYFYASKR